MVKKILKSILPQSVITQYKSTAKKIAAYNDIRKGYKHDIAKFKKLSASFNLDSKDKMSSFLIKEYHAVEKGMALPTPKPGFGVPRITKLISVLNTYIDLYGVDDVARATITSLEEYVLLDEQINKGNKNPVVPMIEKIIERYGNEEADLRGGTMQIEKADILEKLQFDFEGFFKSRHSVRDFSEEPIDYEEVASAIDVAKYCPSVCNRQSWKAYVIKNESRELLDALLANQNGNKGFGDKIKCLIVVTGKLSNFFSYERNQVFIDGGMFAMSILMALHSKGFGTCCLNLSYTAERNRKFDKIMDFDSDVVPIMYIAVGHLKETFKVAKSNRKSRQEIVSIR